MKMKSNCPATLLTKDSIFIRNDAAMPSSFRFNYVECDGWKALIAVNSRALERTALASGWHFSYVASPIVESDYAISAEAAVGRAIRKIMQVVDKAGMNSFETASVELHSVLGFHWARIRANPRHLSATPPHEGPNPYYYPHVAERAEEIFWRMAEVARQSKGL